MSNWSAVTHHFIKEIDTEFPVFTYALGCIHTHSRISIWGFLCSVWKRSLCHSLTVVRLVRVLTKWWCAPPLWADRFFSVSFRAFLGDYHIETYQCQELIFKRRDVSWAWWEGPLMKKVNLVFHKKMSYFFGCDLNCLSIWHLALFCSSW